MPSALAIARTATKAVADDEYYISALCVDPRYRGQAVGSRLLQRALRGRATARTDVSVHNPRALDFYRRHGFTAEGENTVRRRGRTIGHHAIACPGTTAA
jgi:ribosomal protein S18 acetylase RimI-like enzyme